MMEANDIGIALCKKWEGCQLKAYPDPVSGGDPWTIGYGATGPLIREGVEWTQQQADEDLTDRVDDMAGRLFPHVVVHATDNQLGAMLSLAYNVGVNAILNSTLLAKLNSGDTNGAGNEFVRWDMAGGHEVQGLLNRRKDERRVFFGGDV